MLTLLVAGLDVGEQGTEFEYQDDWGETFEGFRTSGLFALHLDTGRIQQLPTPTESIAAAQVGDGGAPLSSPLSSTVLMN